ncbi:MAG: B12-binding domain-containing radical SAM protein [Gammaproteobacteria bacterium]|nr:B12-binding domain-containing radical SAM protein [Gammaproteobacteria bacterium]
MDILLTHAYYLFDDPIERQIMKPYPPLGLLYIAAYLRSLGYQVEVVDSTFMTPGDHHAVIAASKASIVGIYANMITRRNVSRIIAAANQRGATVVMGGPDPVNYTREYLDIGADVIVVGEGEQTVAALLPALKNAPAAELASIPGIVYSGADGEPVTTPPREQIRDLDGLPFPARDSIDMQRYLDTWKQYHGASAVSIITARGCPFTCRWCSHSVYGFTYRRRSVTDVADELEEIEATLAPDRIWYADDVFAMSRHWLRDFAAELERRKLKLPFETISREDRLDAEVIKLLASMGCHRLWVGAESGSQKILDAMDRRTSAARMRHIIKLLQENGIKAGTFIMLGYEGEDWDDLDETNAYLRAALPDEVLMTLAYPIKGTPFYEDVKQRIICKEEWASGSDRDFGIAGRHSHLFYAHAQKWIHSQVQLAKELRRGVPGYLNAGRLYVKSKRHRASMYLTRNQVEGAGDA